ncbi:MAG TPA: methylenetetrahydrofolate reductase [NAD(P)H] [Cyclobacteriaceae bacterium]|nr:methylenetetrahydrofolate reductase [NAD(P)H] [Cyclobacteriaceae bacterium]
MKITEIFKKHKRTFSFEFFPPKNYQSTLELGINLGQLLKLSPSFVSVTYGAGGSTQDLSFDLVDYIQNKLGMTSMAHYTCVNATREKVENDFRYLHEHNIRNLMLLRGDVPKGLSDFSAAPGDLKHATDLIAIAKKTGLFCIGAAGYPEVHRESPDAETDMKWLYNKVALGAEFIVTQMFFDNAVYFQFIEKARAAGINTRIIPGIIPITNFKQIKKFAEIGGASIPASIQDKLETYRDNPDKTYQAGVDIAIAQCIELLEKGAPGIHFYTLNKSSATVDIFSSLPVGLTW